MCKVFVPDFNTARPLPFVIETVDQKPELVSGYTDVYYFPDDKRIGVNQHGEFFNLQTKKMLNVYKNKAGYHTLFITSPGIKIKSYRAHRVFARTFIPRPKHLRNISFRELEVNHKNGIRTCNDYDNLEWCTGSENVLHSVLNSLRSDTKSVQVKCIKTGEITTYASVRRAVDFLKAPRATVLKHLHSKNEGMYAYNGFCVRWGYNSHLPWPELVLAKDTSRFKLQIEFKDLPPSNECYSLLKVCEMFEIKPSRLYKPLSKKGFYNLRLPDRNIDVVIKRIS